MLPNGIAKTVPQKTGHCGLSIFVTSSKWSSLGHQQSGLIEESQVLSLRAIGSQVPTSRSSQ
jgi:hypothetical protein